MKLRKIISTSLAVGLIINNVPTSFAGILSEDGRQESFIDNPITISDILETTNTDIKIEGNTLVNLVAVDAYDNGGLSLEAPFYNFETTYPLNVNKTYSLIVKGLEGIADKICLTNGNGSISMAYTTYRDVIHFTPSRENNKRLYIKLLDGKSINDIANCNIMIFEGNLTSNPPTEYIEGIQSSFEDQLVTQDMINNEEEKKENLGKYKVEVKSTGKNKFIGNNIFDADVLRFKRNDSKPMFLKGRTYTVSSACVKDSNGVSPGIAFRNKNTKIIHTSYLSTATTITMTEDIYDVYVYSKGVEYVSSIGNIVTFSNIQIEEGSVATEYEPYRESINTFYLNSPLLEGDTIEYINGQATHVRRYSEVVLDGSEYWTRRNLDYNSENTIYFSTNKIDGKTKHVFDSPSLISDKFSYSTPIWDTDNEGIIIEGNIENVDVLRIRIKKSKLNTIDVEGFKEWLSENPVTVIYELAEPIYEPIKADLSVQLFKGTTHISNNSSVPTNMKVTVDRTINRASEAIELAKTNPTLENLARARMWVNLLEESTLKDELQGEISNITNVEDVQLERKSATANLDVYIKSENMLSMSLNTNSITFDNYSGVEDMELEDAIGISINSSLPYDLTASLESDIQNSDNSNTMDIDMLKIKDSSKNDYQSFINTNDKLILNEDCSAGNYISHNIDLKLQSNNAYVPDVYKTTIKFEATQK